MVDQTSEGKSKQSFSDTRQHEPESLSAKSDESVNFSEANGQKHEQSAEKPSDQRNASLLLSGKRLLFVQSWLVIRCCFQINTNVLL